MKDFVLNHNSNQAVITLERTWRTCKKSCVLDLTFWFMVVCSSDTAAISFSDKDVFYFSITLLHPVFMLGKMKATRWSHNISTNVFVFGLESGINGVYRHFKHSLLFLKKSVKGIALLKVIANERGTWKFVCKTQDCPTNLLSPSSDINFLWGKWMAMFHFRYLGKWSPRLSMFISQNSNKSSIGNS